MNQSELILKTYREISTKLDQPYYVLGGVSGEITENQILYSSPNLKNIIGLSQFDLSRDSKLFYDSIHPGHLEEYFATNQQLQITGGKVKRSYLVKNQQTGEFINVEELASSRLNKEKNCFEIYCSIKEATRSYENVATENELTRSVYAPEELPNDDRIKKLNQTASYFLETLHAHFKMHACRFYAFNDITNKLILLADIQNRNYQKNMEDTAGVKMRSVIPPYSPTSYFFNIVSTKQAFITDKNSEIVRILKAHSDRIFLKQLSPVAVRIYKLRSFGILPVTCPDGRIIGVVTFGSAHVYSDEVKKLINDFTVTNCFAFCCQLGELIHSK